MCTANAAASCQWREWKAIKGQRAIQPYAIAMKDGSPFSIGGIWENWKEPSFGEWMPPAGYLRWLSEEQDPRDQMRPFPSKTMRMWPISTRVNNDDPSILDETELATEAA